MIRTVIFDIDNTLYNYDLANKKALEEISAYTVKHFGWEPDRIVTENDEMMKRLRKEMGEVASYHNRMIRYQNILEKNHLSLEPHALNMYDIYWDTLIANVRDVYGARRLLRELKKSDIKIGIGTDMTAHMQFMKLRQLGLIDYLDFVVTSEEAVAEKPDKKLFSLCLSKASAEPEDCLFVGDNYKKDYCGAIASGMHALWFTPPDKEIIIQDEEMKNAHRITSLAEVLNNIA